MSTSRGKPLSDWSESELLEVIRGNAPHLAYPQDELVRELDRRRDRRLAHYMLASTVAATVAAFASAAAAALALIR